VGLLANVQEVVAALVEEDVGEPCLDVSTSARER